MRPSDFPELPAFLFTDQPWADQALCREVDPELFYPEKGGVKTATKAVCAACIRAAVPMPADFEMPRRRPGYVPKPKMLTADPADLKTARDKTDADLKETS